MAKILILIGAHLCTAPRPQKEAQVLSDAGYDVTVSGVWFNPELIERDRLLMANKKWRFQPILDFQPTQRWQNLGIRLQARLVKEKYQRFGTFSPSLLGYGAFSMLRAARKASSDLTIVHSEAGLWVGNRLLDEGLRVGVDFEDWFSEDLLPETRATRPIAQLKTLESRLARDCTYCLTTSHVLADALAVAYQATKPKVIYNTFPWAQRQLIDGQKRDRHNLNLPSLHWFSQTIGPGRGLETLFQALPYLKIPLEIHLRGNYPETASLWLEPLIPDAWRKAVFIHPTVTNEELLSRIAEHDIGLALESTDIKSRNLTVTNKLFQYLQAGLAVIATDTAGQKEVISQHPDVGRVIPTNNPLTLAQAIEDLLEAKKLAIAKTAALKIASENFSWEHQAKNITTVSLSSYFCSHNQLK
ncbi:MAG: glycosyltransferase family 4 protein [Calothrix sp. SM1_7_51]|nr:glycosyltransferase family 4 protein [Calothrix sp. SM1_7_51]